MTDTEKALASLGQQVLKLRAENQALLALIVERLAKDDADKTQMLDNLSQSCKESHEKLLLKIGDRQPEAAYLMDLHKVLPEFPALE